MFLFGMVPYSIAEQYKLVQIKQYHGYIESVCLLKNNVLSDALHNARRKQKNLYTVFVHLSHWLVLGCRTVEIVICCYLKMVMGIWYIHA